MANVYAIGFPNGKLYIGITSKAIAQRFTKHLNSTRAGSKLPVHHALRKYGRNVQLIVLAQGVSFDEAKDLEIWWISGLATMAPNGYNLTKGGDGVVGCKTQLGMKRTEEAKANMRNAAKARVTTLKGIKQLAIANEKSQKAKHHLRETDASWRANELAKLERSRKSRQKRYIDDPDFHDKVIAQLKRAAEKAHAPEARRKAAATNRRNHKAKRQNAKS